MRSTHGAHPPHPNRITLSPKVPCRSMPLQDTTLQTFGSHSLPHLTLHHLPDTAPCNPESVHSFPQHYHRHIGFTLLPDTPHRFPWALLCNHIPITHGMCMHTHTQSHSWHPIPGLHTYTVPKHPSAILLEPEESGLPPSLQHHLVKSTLHFPGGVVGYGVGGCLTYGFLSIGIPPTCEI